MSEAAPGAADISLGSLEAAEPGEILFEFDELFFSRTDEAGIIKFGNSVFQRISHYSWDELLEKPHKIIRHRDMPRAVFWLLWDTIKRGAPIGAFVKNRAKDGRFYWVYAIVTPIAGGFLSVRLRPSSVLLGVVKQEYSALTAREQNDGLAPGESAKLLLARLGELGFRDYAAFMASALGAEMAARDEAIGRAPDRAIASFDDLLKTAQRLLTQAEGISSAYIVNETVPFNFRVLAAQLGQDGAAIGIISSNYSLLATEMQTILADFIASAQDVYRAICEGYFLSLTARAQREMSAFFQDETPNDGHAREQEVALLERQQSEYSDKALASLVAISQTVSGFQRACLDMNRLAAGLEVMRVMGKVECARHQQVKGRMDELLGDLEAFQRTIASALKELNSINLHIQSEADRLLLARAS